MDFDAIYRTAFGLLGLTPAQTDDLSLREYYLLVAAARERERQAWQHTLAVCTAILNWGGPRGERFQQKPLGYLYERSFKPRRKAKPVMPRTSILSALRSLPARDADTR